MSRADEERGPLVTVVIPAYNAESTLERTLDSVLAQTYRRLEILIIDDGSKDGTLAIAQRYAAADDRIRVIPVSNGGVATARNRGIEEGHGEFVAPVDADDLWHPQKTERQVRALMAAGKHCAFVYSPARIIDADDRLIATTRCLGIRGHTVHRHLYLNYVGNGSGILARREVLLALGGYDKALQEHGAHGCEDMLLQLRMAVRYDVEVVPDYLVGYRHIAGNMSSNHRRMARSYHLALKFFSAENPGLKSPGFAWGEASYLLSLFKKSLLSKQRSQAWEMFSSAMKLDIPGSVLYLWDLLWTRASRRLMRALESSPVPAPLFSELPLDGFGPSLTGLAGRRMSRLQRMDACFPSDGGSALAVSGGLRRA